MPRIIKSNQVNFSEDIYKVDVPDRDLFAQEFSQDNYGDEYDDYGDGEQPEVSYEELIKNAEDKAAAIIDNARETADKIIMEAKEQAERDREAIFEEARTQGYEKGRHEAETEGKKLINEANKTLESAIAEKERLLREAEPEAVSVVIETIEKLLGDIVKLNPGVIACIIRAGIDGAPGAKQLFIRVSDEDYETASGLKDEILAYVDSDMAIDIIKDASLELGDCVIDTPIGSVDSSLKTQWGGLKKDLILMLKALEG